MSFYRAIERFLAEVREAEEQSLNQNPIPPNNPQNLKPLNKPPSNLDMDEASRATNPPPLPNTARSLVERVELLEREIHRLTRNVRRLERRLASVTAERDRLQEEVDRLRGNIP